jgi:hypothetical protein
LQARHDLAVSRISCSGAIALVAAVAVGCSSRESSTEEQPPVATASVATEPLPAAPEEPTRAEEAADAGTAVRLVALGPDKIAHCRRSDRLAPICPMLVPRVRAPYLSNLSDQATDALFNLERGIPGSAPPEAAHITVGAGDIERSDPFEHPTASDAVSRLDDQLLDKERQEPVSFGTATWGGTTGLLFLAPPFLHGGQLGDHLVFEWGTGNERAEYSLHAWKPLADTAATLREMIEALP